MSEPSAWAAASTAGSSQGRDRDAPVGAPWAWAGVQPGDGINARARPNNPADRTLFAKPLNPSSLGRRLRRHIPSFAAWGIDAPAPRSGPMGILFAFPPVGLRASEAYLSLDN